MISSHGHAHSITDCYQGDSWHFCSALWRSRVHVWRDGRRMSRKSDDLRLRLSTFSQTIFESGGFTLFSHSISSICRCEQTHSFWIYTNSSEDEWIQTYSHSSEGVAFTKSIAELKVTQVFDIAKWLRQHSRRDVGYTIQSFLLKFVILSSSKSSKEQIAVLPRQALLLLQTTNLYRD